MQSSPALACHQAGLQLVHAAVPGRTRFRGALLRYNPGLAARIASGLARQPGITSAVANPQTGSLLVHYRKPVDLDGLCAAVVNLIASKGRDGMTMAHSLSAASLPTSEDLPRPWHAMATDAVLGVLMSSQDTGLTNAESNSRLQRYGGNVLARGEPRSTAAIFLDQMTSLPIALLGMSAGLSLVSGGIADAVAIMAAILLNAGIATATERGAERTILGMLRYEPQPVPVLRDGKRVLLDPAVLVPGDVVLIEQGILVPADTRLIEANELTVNESALTGESMPVLKTAAAVLTEDAPLAERLTMLFRGTAVIGGHGRAVVISTGGQTEIGRIQSLLGTVRPPETPIQRQLGEVDRELILINGAICCAVFGLGVMRGQGLLAMSRSAISLAVAAIPEGLPAVATTILALGVQDMQRRKVLVRRLEAIETLGAAEIVSLDKTGTLTANRMATVAFHYDGELVEFAVGRVNTAGHRKASGPDDGLRRMLESAVLCSEATLVIGQRATKPVGTPTECAILQAALDIGIDIDALRARYPLLAMVPRSEGRKRVSSLHTDPGDGHRLCVKGDPVEVLALCDSQLTKSGPVPLDETARERIARANGRMAGRALRVLGVAMRRNGGDPQGERNLLWLGLIGIADPLRPGAREAIHTLHGAGLRTVMITGDQSITAYAIAKQLNLGNGGEIKILEAGQIRDVSPEVLAALAPQAQVFARISPANKLQIVRALQAKGHIVAMTGDGINDGPALRAADVGIAMGSQAADVAREVADVVLTTDDLNGIVEGIRLGRATYANIRKVLRYLVGTGASETMLMLGAAIAGWPAPLTPLQLLWLNLLSDAMPGIALGLEPPEPSVLQEKPHDPRAPILTRQDFRRLLREGTVLGAGGIATFLFAGGAAEATGVSRGNTIAFHALIISQLLHAFACRSETHGLLEQLKRPPNLKLVGAVGGGLILQVAAQTFPPLSRLLQMIPLRPGDLGAILTAALGPLAVNEILTALFRREGGLPDL